MTKTLNIIESAYRATLEEQDDTIVWVVSAMRKGGADVDVLLSGNAVNYAVRGQSAAGLELGEWKQTQPPNLERDLEAIMSNGARVFVVADDAAERGLEGTDFLPAVAVVQRARLAELLSEYGRVWHW